ncbi:MAG: transporter substrate-binding domain-containing protein [Fusobacteriota bacterium]
MAQEDEDLLNEVDFVKTPLSSEELYIAIGFKNPRHKELINAFNKGLEEIKESGKYKEIMEKYGIEIRN